MEKDHYAMWAELFEIHARGHNVIDHIIPQPGKDKPGSADASFEMWKNLDSTVIQWIYSNISFHLLTTIMEKGPTAMAAGNAWLISLRIIKTNVQFLLSKISHPLAWRIFLMFLPILKGTMMTPLSSAQTVVRTIDLDPATAVSTLVSLGLVPTSLECASLPLSYNSVDSTHRSFEAAIHSRPAPSGSHCHGFTSTH
ncbi:hypothetical protein MTR_7g015400 [Medicago truncatula]|uniref:Uncharacterized protein n=1 Tax=Medicago truncatula TaxID=3880 RepID=A0A072TWZ6_MEDTR|nr:hypothetical protein MTR_7g015400 [Medicago truncatula]